MRIFVFFESVSERERESPCLSKSSILAVLSVENDLPRSKNYYIFSYTFISISA